MDAGIERCATCKHYRDLEHNFRPGDGYEKSHCCIVMLSREHLATGWVHEVAPTGMCDKYEERGK